MGLQRLSLALGLVGIGCADIAGFDGNPQMNPGKDCLECHSPSGEASNLSFSVGGTVYPAALAGTEGGLFNAEIDITDFNNRQFTLHSNGAGNFYSAEPIAFPASVSIKVGGQIFAMNQQPPMGRCNACHAVSANPDGTLWPSPLPAFGVDAGFTTNPPGHLYAFPPTTCPGSGSGSCPSPAPSYSNQVKAIIQANCFSCHNPAAPPSEIQPPALDDYADIKANAPDCQSMVNDCQMTGLNLPAYSWFPMSLDERAILQSWFNCGSPSN